ncbi:MAG TPA: DUF1015 domain-containing protein [Kiritimatiellia bacterium]|nr:DUF1015 domain-containing protein [Kiritimatiellia bacterium]HNR93563.1 DUF1015 domain-containing protein [Kiritimatiellia bacterium]HNS80138.1 DUF1015 domain-containing protein [Kiritimatiellia bacterium]
MSDIRPFCGYRPRADAASQIASPPYDVLNSDEARERVRGNPLSFLHVTKSEVDLDPSIDVHSDVVYQRGADNLKKMVADGLLIKDREPCMYVYAQRMGEHVQTGLLCGGSVAEYQNDLIKKHELTRKDKEDDRTHHVEMLGAHTGCVFLTYRARPEIDAIIGRICAQKPVYDFTADDGIGHTLWVVDAKADIAALQTEFKKVPALYVADGHHRSAAASRVGEILKKKNPKHTGEEMYNYFLTVIFPGNQLRIMDYNRVVKDLNGLSPEEFLKKISDKFGVSPTGDPRPAQKGDYGMLLGNKWYRLTAKPGSFPSDDPVQSLDVSILQNNLLDPVLGIKDPRTDVRIDFVGGIRGLKELERRCKLDSAVAFALFPTGVEELMAIADAGQIMPPKSTWFEPKLRDGLVVKMLNE